MDNITHKLNENEINKEESESKRRWKWSKRKHTTLRWGHKGQSFLEMS